MITIINSNHKQFHLKYKETTLAIGLTNMQNKQEINLKKTGIPRKTYFYVCLRNWCTYKQLVELLDEQLVSKLTLTG